MNVTRVPSPTVAVREFQYEPDALCPPELSNDEIHVWHQSLTWGSGVVQGFREVLSPDELARAERYRFNEDRKEYILARGTLRVLLASYATVPAKELRFGYSEFGRPRLLPETRAEAVDFNVTHSGDMALFAFARGRRIGIDVEKVRRDFATSEIAERFFSTAERGALRELPLEQRHAAFFRCWTRKEAFIKALGEGLSHPLDQFDVSLGPGVPPALLATRPDPEEVKRWTLWNIKVPSDYAAALAAESNSTSA
jgi:4'-phosphopantetheinyl transferase